MVASGRGDEGFPSCFGARAASRQVLETGRGRRGDGRYVGGQVQGGQAIMCAPGISLEQLGVAWRGLQSAWVSLEQPGGASNQLGADWSGLAGPRIRWEQPGADAGPFSAVGSRSLAPTDRPSLRCGPRPPSC